MKKKSTGLLFITPFILFFMLFWLIPFIYGIVMSLSKYSLIMGNQGFVGFSNYIKILVGDSMYHNSFLLGLKNTVIFTACTTPFLVLGSLGLHYCLIGFLTSAKEYSERFILPRILFRLLRWQLYLYG